MPSHADTHDLDKLKRWQRELEAIMPDAPAVYAIFLLSEVDTEAHAIFRAFRDSFEERNAGLAHLVIFGQHGVSTTVRALQPELSLAENMLPALVIFGGDTEDGEYITADTIALPRGGPDNPELQQAYWWADMYWSDEILAEEGNAPLFFRTDVLVLLGEDSTEDAPDPVTFDLAEALQWAEDKMNDSKAVGGPPALNRVLKKRLTDLCGAVIDVLG